MRVRALRGVCVGVERHLKPGDVADLEPGQVPFLVGIGAVAPVPDEPIHVDPETEQAPESTLEPKSKAGKSGVKEK